MRYGVRPHPYGGDDPKKRAKAREYDRVALKVAGYLNERSQSLAPDEQLNIMSHSVAHEIEEDSETVRRIIMSYQGGSNGMFIFGPSRDQSTP